MTVSFHPMIYDAQSASWRAVDEDFGDPDAFELNLSNANATDLLAALGMASCENAEPYPIEAMSASRDGRPAAQARASARRRSRPSSSNSRARSPSSVAPDMKATSKNGWAISPA